MFRNLKSGHLGTQRWTKADFENLLKSPVQTATIPYDKAPLYRGSAFDSLGNAMFGTNNPRIAYNAVFQARLEGFGVSLDLAWRESFSQTFLSFFDDKFQYLTN